MTVQTCSACEQSGLAFVFVYNSAVATDAQFAPPDSAKLKSHEVSINQLTLPALTNARYVLRSLRPGAYLHIYHENPPSNLRRAASKKQLLQKYKEQDPDDAHWEVFRVVPGGALMPEGEPSFANAAPFSCNVDNRSHIYTAMTYRLQEAHDAAAIWVAVSGNLWDKKLRAKNKKNPAVMRRIDVSKAITSSGPDLIQPDATWLNTYIADFALDNFKHGGRDSCNPLIAKVRGNGQFLVDRMRTLAKGHPKTEGKGFIVVLSDPVGTSEAVGEIARARYQQGLDYSYSQRHPLGAATSIEFIRSRVYDQQLDEVKHDCRPLKESNLYTPKGTSIYTDSAIKLAPNPEELERWVRIGTMSYMNFIEGQRTFKDVPESARWLQLKGQYMSDLGTVIAPASDYAQVKTKRATRKMDRLHDHKAAAKFKEQFEKQLAAYNDKVAQHDKDRAKLLEYPALKKVFSDHYDTSEPNTVRSHIPGLTYMEEVTKALLGWGALHQN